MGFKKYLVVLALNMMGTTLLTQPALATAPMDQTVFQHYVLNFLQQNFKQHQFALGNKPEVIKVGSNEINLDSAYQSYKEAQLSPEQLNLAIAQYYGPILSELNKANSEQQSQWQVAKNQVRPQLAPSAYLDRAELVHQKLDDNMIATFVIDDEHSYQYVTGAHLKAWGISIEDLATAANANLVAKSANMPMNIATEGDRFIVIKANDGYDAARLMVPEIRSFISGHLGEPFYAAMPYRDILLAWSGQNSEAFLKQMKLSVQNDFAQQQYALSPNFFEVTLQGFSVVAESEAKAQSTKSDKAAAPQTEKKADKKTEKDKQAKEVQEDKTPPER